jgi:DNA-binding transcriptional LysR family regulator
MYSVLPIALKMFHTERPNVELKLYEMVTEEQTDALHEGRIHVGIGRQPAVVAGCTTQVLLRERVMAVLPPEHPSAGDESVRIADLVASPLILYPKQPTAQFAVFIESFFRAEGFVPRVEHRTFEIQTAIALVSAGLGITFVGESVAALGRGDVVYRYLAGSDAARVTTLEATYGTNDSSPHLRAFLGCLPDLGITGVADAAV